MTKYLFALDLDGTILDRHKNISRFTKKYFRKLQEKGHIVVIATGRPYRAAKRYYEELNLETPLICYNGAFVYAPKDATFPNLVSLFKKDLVFQVLKTLTGLYSNVLLETNEEIFFDHEDHDLSPFFWKEDMKVYQGNVFETLFVDPMTVILRVDKEAMPLIQERLLQYPELEARAWAFLPFCEISYRQVSKSSGIRLVAQHYDVASCHIVAAGDSDNDLLMVEDAAIGIAMKNAIIELKAIADYVTVHDNNHNGLPRLIKKLLRKKIINEA
ncbi:MAG: Cof-type HAD-IIB family hydrolase [Erysipelotrichaceae bacterium]|jgi:Cof subfamily protein (haloacid dehalogenase superfamily)|nr:Cof-type HAD-IIB family hydrolase [Erysipelotrichaceae bacterium]